MEKKEQLKQTIEKSALSQKDKLFWQSFIDPAPEIFISSVVDVLSEYPKELPWLTQIYKRKQEAFKTMRDDQVKGQELLSQIYKEERVKLKELADKQ